MGVGKGVAHDGRDRTAGISIGTQGEGTQASLPTCPDVGRRGCLKHRNTESGCSPQGDKPVGAPGPGDEPPQSGPEETAGGGCVGRQGARHPRGGLRTEQSSTLPGATEEAREGPAARCHRAQSATLGRQGAAGDKGPALGCREMPWPQGTDCSLGAPGPPSRSSGSISPGEAGLPCLEGGSVATGMGPRRCEERKPEVGTLRGRLHPRGQ